MMKKVLGIAVCALVLIAASSAAFAQNSYDAVFDTSADAGRLTARFLSMTTVAGKKSGDSIILTSPDGKVMVIDAGYDDCGEQVAAALRTMGVSCIDYLVESHPHADHIGGFLTLLRTFKVKQLITSYREYPDSRVLSIVEEIENQNIEHVRMSMGDTIDFGGDVVVEVLWPGEDVEAIDDFSENSVTYVNNHSLVLKFTYGEFTMLFGGDLYIGSEWKITTQYGECLDCDVLKANHHGDRTSSSKPFRDAVSPQITVIIADTMEDMHIYEEYVKDGSAVFHTHFDGNVKVSTDGDGTYQILTETDRDW